MTLKVTRCKNSSCINKRESNDTCSFIENLTVYRPSDTLTPILLDVKIANALHLDTSICWLKELSLRILTYTKQIGTNFILTNPLTKGLKSKAFHEDTASTGVAPRDTLV
ncbi:hypothetical protein CR513_13311, partial [Mucuna pruriens]